MESNVAQIFELTFAIVKDNCLPTYLENNINAILKSHSNLYMGRYVAAWKNLIKIFQLSPGIKSLYDRGRKIIHLLAGRHNLGPGR